MCDTQMIRFVCDYSMIAGLLISCGVILCMNISVLMYLSVWETWQMPSGLVCQPKISSLSTWCLMDILDFRW